MEKQSDKRVHDKKIKHSGQFTVNCLIFMSKILTNVNENSNNS